MKVKYFQQGGQAPVAEAPGAPAKQGPNPEEQIAQMAQQILEQMGPEAAAMLAQMILQMLQSAPQEQPQGQPVMQRRGGRLVMIGRR